MIEIKNVSKSFGEIQAVSQVSLTLKEQNVFGMLGTNGAGQKGENDASNGNQNAEVKSQIRSILFWDLGKASW